MAITILSTPREFQPVYSIDGHNLSFVLDSDKSFLCSMNYIMDLYINDVFINRFKNFPNLDGGKCVFQIDGVVNNFLSYDIWEGPDFQICGNSYMKYMVQFGEEDDGTINCTGNNFNVTMGPSFSGWAFNGTLQYLDGEFIETQYYIQNIATPSNFLTNSPDVINTHITDNQYLYYINNMNVATASGPTASQAMKVNVIGNTQSKDWYVLNQRNIPSKTIVGIGTSPKNINDYVQLGIVYDGFGIQATQSIINCDTIRYEVEITNYEIVG